MCKVDTGSYSYRYSCYQYYCLYGCNDIVVDIFNFNIGTSEIKIPFINKAIALDKDDINEFKEMLSKIQQ